MSNRPSIIWHLLDQEGPEVMWTPGWKPDSNVVRWSLGASIRVEGVREGWHNSFEASENATLWFSYVGADEAGDDVEVDSEGLTVWGDRVDEWQPATLARLHIGTDD